MMLVQPKVKMYIESDVIILEVEDEGTVIKIDYTDKVLSLVEELNTR